MEGRWGDGTTNRLWSKPTPLQIFNHPRGIGPKSLGFMRVFGDENFRYLFPSVWPAIRNLYLFIYRRVADLDFRGLFWAVCAFVAKIYGYGIL